MLILCLMRLRCEKQFIFIFVAHSNAIRATCLASRSLNSFVSVMKFGDLFSDFLYKFMSEDYYSWALDAATHHSLAATAAVGSFFG